MSERSVIYSIFSPDHLVGELAARYPALGIEGIELFSRSWTDVYKLRTAQRRYALRIWRADFHPLPQIAFECEYLAFLSERGFTVQTALAANDGQHVQILPAPDGDRPMALLRWVDGHPIGTGANAATAEEIGALLAAMHIASQSCLLPVPTFESFPARCRRMLPDVEKALTDRPVDCDAILSGISRVADQLDDLANRLPRGLIHGDFHANNVLRMPCGNLAPIDFDDLAPDVLIRDVGAFLWAAEYLGETEEYRQSFLRGYESIRPLEPGEREALPLILADRDCWNILGWTTSLNQLGDPAGVFQKMLMMAQSRFATL